MEADGFKKMATPPPGTTYYGVLLYCVVLPGPTRDHDPLHQGLLLGPPLAKVPQGQGSVYTAHPRVAAAAGPPLKQARQAGTRPPGFLCPEAQVNRTRNSASTETYVNEENGVEHGMKG